MDKNYIGINSFLGGQRYGHTWPPESLLPEVKLKRFFMTFGEFCEKPGVYAIDFTPKGWAWKESLQEYKNQGVRVLAATAGGFDWQNQDGNINKKMPINAGDDKYSEASYKEAARCCYYLAALYGSNKNAAINPDELQKAVTGAGFRRATEPIAGQELIWCIEVRQEALGWKKGWNGVTEVDDPRSMAVSFFACLKEIWKADPDMNVCVGALVHNEPQVFQQMNDEFKKLSGHSLQDYPRPGKGEIIAQFHNYIHNGMLGKPRTHAVSPEVVDLKLKEWDAMNIPYIIGEFGSDTVSGNTPQLTPLVAGLNIEQSMAELNNRHILWYSTAKNCIAVVPYQIRNDNDAGGVMYRTCGYFTRQYKPKAGLPVFLDFIEKFTPLEGPSIHIKEGNFEVFYFKNGTAKYSPNTRIEFTGTVVPPPPPPPTNEKPMIKYSYKNDRSEPKDLTNGVVLKPGTIFIFSDKPGTFILKRDGAAILPGGSQREGAAPYDMGGTDEVNKVAKPVNLPAGNYELEFEGSKISFTVKDEVPPPTKPIVTVNIESPETVDLKVFLNGKLTA